MRTSPRPWLIKYQGTGVHIVSHTAQRYHVLPKRSIGPEAVLIGVTPGEIPINPAVNFFDLRVYMGVMMLMDGVCDMCVWMWIGQVLGS